MNGFLATLDNISTPPVNGLSTTGNVLWPSPFFTQTYTPDEQEARYRLFGDCPTRFTTFAKAIQLLWLVEDSVLSDAILETDPVITYANQLIGQLEGVATDDLKAATQAIAQLPYMKTSILDDDLREVWEHALSPVDKVATFIVHFGRKYAG